MEVELAEALVLVELVEKSVKVQLVICGHEAIGTVVIGDSVDGSVMLIGFMEVHLQTNQVNLIIFLQKLSK